MFQNKLINFPIFSLLFIENFLASVLLDIIIMSKRQQSSYFFDNTGTNFL